MRAVGVFALALLGACTTPVEGGSYALPPGVASYDTLKAATDKCDADGGQLAVRGGYDKRELSNYQCNIGAPR